MFGLFGWDTYCDTPTMGSMRTLYAKPSDPKKYLVTRGQHEEIKAEGE
jgi:hypothetical protein